ncbi:MAG: hypothetical protein ACK44H_10115 [Candidatus Kryptonium sp.]
MEKLQLLNSLDAFYPQILLAVLPIVFMFAGLWFIFKIFKKVEGQSGWIKESEIFADKKFADYLSEKNFGDETMPEVQEKKEFKAKESVEIKNDVDDFSESEILKLAKRYSVGQGEVELLLNLRSKAKKNGNYDKILSEIEKGVDIRKVAKKYGIGCGEVQLLLAFKNANQNSLWKSENKLR